MGRTRCSAHGSMMMVVVMMTADGGFIGVTLNLVAEFPLRFRFNGHMGDPVVGKHLSNGVFNGVKLGVCYKVHGGAAVLTVHAPQMDMVYIQHAV